MIDRRAHPAGRRDRFKLKRRAEGDALKSAIFMADPVPATETKRLTERSGVLFYIAIGELSFKLRSGARASQRSAPFFGGILPQDRFNVS